MLVNLPPATWSSFELELELYVGDGTGGEGMSVCLGALPDAPFGEYGSGDGLRLLLRTHEGDLQAWYGGVAAVRRPFDASLLRASRFVALRLQYSDAGLVVELGGVELVRGLVFGRWSPEPGWRVGIGARTGAGRTDAHRVSAVRFSAGAGDPSPALVELLRTGSSSRRAASRSRTPSPGRVGLLPRARSLERLDAGGDSGREAWRGVSLRVQLWRAYGSGELRRERRHGSLRLGGARGGSGDAGGVAERAAVHEELGPLRVLREPRSESGEPRRRPNVWGHALRVHGSGLDAGADCRCRFGLSEVESTIDDATSPATLLCVSPSSNSSTAVPLEISLNNQNYTSSSVAFSYYDVPHVSAVEPSSGLFYGGTTVTVRGSGLRADLGIADVQCRFGRTLTAWYDSTPQKWFGDSLVAASFANGSMLCVTPTSAQSGAARRIEVTFAASGPNGSGVLGVGGGTGLLLGRARVVPSASAVELTSESVGEIGSLLVRPRTRRGRSRRSVRSSACRCLAGCVGRTASRATAVRRV